MNQKLFYWSGQFTLALRLIIGWTYFSAFWRRLILDNKLIQDEVGYIGEKFNHFLPHALFIKPIIEYLVSNPELLWYNMVIFTIVEAIVGFCLLLGVWTRFMSIGVIFLATGILLGAGWLGTTCLDEWQIGILGIGGGIAILFTGGGKYAFDYWFTKKNILIPFDKLLTPTSSRYILMISLFALGIALYTNQVFHGGVIGTLHNKSVKPKLELKATFNDTNKIGLDIYRTEGADVYGSFLIKILFKSHNGEIIHSLDQQDLANFNPQHIKNYYVTKVKADKHSMLIPLGAKATLTLSVPKEIKKHINEIVLIDISGAEWSTKII